MNDIWKRVSSIGLVVVFLASVLMSFPLISAAPPDKCEPWPECKDGGDGEEPPADPAIAFIKARSKNGKEPNRIAVMNEDGERQTVIYSEARSEHPTWSPDGGSIAFEAVGTSGWEIWAIDVAVVDDEPQSSNPRMLANATACDGRHCVGPEWSPAGDVIAVYGLWFMSNDGIYLIPKEGIPAGGRAEKIFTPSGENDRAVMLAWSPNATQIAFWYGDRSGESVVVSIKILDLTMSPPQVVKTLVEGGFTSGSVSCLDWARTKDELTFVGVPTDGEEKSLYTLDIDTETLTIVTDAGGHPSWSSDDAQIAFGRAYSSQGGNRGYWKSVVYTIWSIDLETGTETELARDAWSPDWKR